MKINVIIPCGGNGSRMALGYNKLFADLQGAPIIAKTVSAFLRPDISKVILACAQCDKEWFEKNILPIHQDIVLCNGGITRSHSVANALQCVDQDCDYVIIHDGARPFVSQQIINNAIATAIQKGNATTAVDCVDSLRLISDCRNTAVNRKNYKCVQTPQIFLAKEIVLAYEKANAEGLEKFTDDASIYEKYIGKVFLCEGETKNKKVTNPEDLQNIVPKDYRVGIGWDTHQLVENRKLILAGIEVPHEKGLLGHSDADVVTHSIMDSLLSASNNRDIGVLFPDTDEKYKGACSIELLKNVNELLQSQNYKINNISATIMAQKPKLKDYIPLMQNCLADALQLLPSQVCLTATTTEKLGLIGKEQAISCQAICGIIKNKN